MTQRRGVVGGAVGFLLTLAVSPIAAQTTGRIEGRVVDQVGDALPGALVGVESTSLQGARSVVSDDHGRFRFPVVPPGAYAVRVELAGFAVRVLPEVRVGLDRTATLEVEMQPALTEAMTVEGESPILDLAGTTTGADYDESLLRAHRSAAASWVWLSPPPGSSRPADSGAVPRFAAPPRPRTVT